MRVPFPFVEQERLQARPTLIVSSPVGPAGTLLWSVMVTSARRGAWPGDIATGDQHALFGLPVPCFIRTAKVATLSVATIERSLGKLPADLLGKVRTELRAALHWL